MANKERKTKSIVYKRAEITPNTKTLQLLLKDALKKKPKTSERKEIVDDGSEDSKVRRVITKVMDEQTMLCGSMLLYEVGKDLTFVIEDDESTDYELESLNPSSSFGEEDKKKREVLESALYFGVFGNHVVLVQSAALKARDLEKHLKWLINSASEDAESSIGLSLTDEPTKEARERINNLQVKSVELGAPITASEPSNSSVTKSVSTGYRLSPSVISMLSYVMPKGSEVLSTLELESALEDSNLEVMLQLRYKRKTNESGHAALDKIARAMRHAEPEDTKVTTTSGTIIKGELLRLTGKISVDTLNGVVDSQDLYERMFTWLEDRITEGSVG